MRANGSQERMSGFLEFTRDEETGRLIPPELHCPFGHRIPWEYAFHEAGYPRCRHRAKGSGVSDCNARLFAQFFSGPDREAPPIMFIAAITEQELLHVFEERMDTFEILKYLGAGWAPSTCIWR